MLKAKVSDLNWLKIGAHISVWIILMLLPILSTTELANGMKPILKRNWLPLFFYAIIFYLNYLYLINSFLFKKKYVLFLVFSVLVIFILVGVNWLVVDMNPPHLLHEGKAFNDMIDHPPRHLGPPPPPRIFFNLLKVLAYAFPVVLSIALKAMENRLNLEDERKEIHKQHLETELQNLKYQLHPHFFFNSLNNIYSLIELSKSKAQEAVHGLSKLMRYLLNNNGTQKVQLIDEVNFLEKYIHLMSLRQSNLTDTKVILPSDTECLNLEIYPFLLMPIFENAYKHGVSSIHKSIISFELKIENNVLSFVCKNPLYTKNEHDKSGSGIGLNNLDKRLEILYPNNYRVTVDLKDNTYKTILIIEL
jgi:energy-coupling factor transporter transmembrane protein EcfT